MKQLADYIFEGIKYMDDLKFEKLFFSKIIKEEPFKSTIGKCDKEAQDLFIYLIYDDIVNYGYYLPSAGNRIVMNEYIWNQLKKYTDGYGLAEMIKILHEYMKK